jgi:hypothetical protein
MKDLALSLDAMKDSRVIGGVVENDRPNVVVHGQDIFFGDADPYVFKEKEVYEEYQLGDN